MIMAKRPKKRYHTIEQILKEIDRYKTKAVELRLSAAADDRRAVYLLDNKMPAYAHTLQLSADRARASAGRIYEKKLPHLKQKLAEMMTPQIPAIDNGDKSISS